MNSDTPSKAIICFALFLCLFTWAATNTASPITLEGALKLDEFIRIQQIPAQNRARVVSLKLVSDQSARPSLRLCVGLQFDSRDIWGAKLEITLFDAAGKILARHGHAEAVGPELVRRDGHNLDLIRQWKHARAIWLSLPKEVETANRYTIEVTELAEDPRAMDLHLGPARYALRVHLRGQRADVVAFSPDGKMLAVGGDSPTVRVMDAKTGETIARHTFLSKEEEAALFDSDVAGVGVRKVVKARALAFSPDSSVLAVGCESGQVKLFDARSGALQLTLDDAAARKVTTIEPGSKSASVPRAQGNVWSLAFSPVGSLLATCGDPIVGIKGGGRLLDLRRETRNKSGILKLWDAKTGALKLDLLGHRTQVRDVAFSPDGTYLASAGNWFTGRDNQGIEQRSGVKLWDPQTGELRKEILTIDNGGGLSLAFSPDGKRIAIGTMRYDKNTDITSGAIHVAYVASGVSDLVWPVPVSVGQVAFSFDGKTIAARTVENTVTIWNSITGKAICHLRPQDQPDAKRRVTFTFSPRANVLAIAGSAGQQESFIEVWELDGSSAESSVVKPGPTATRTAANPVEPFL